MAEDGATLKINRASEHIDELDKLFRKTPPFSYVLEGDTESGERATFAKKNELAIARSALICGDAIHNLRCALDHAYWKIVSPFATSDRERRAIQFPFIDVSARLDEAFQKSLADRVSQSFLRTLHDLKPHSEQNGNKLLYMVHRLDILDKHKILIPTADCTRLSSELVRAELPELPLNIRLSSSFGQNKRDVVWFGQPMSRQARRSRGLNKGKFEIKLNIPVGVIFTNFEFTETFPVVPTLYGMVEAVSSAVERMRRA